ncbi:hypothetical protein [Acinetobacter sp. GXMZU3951]|jgi:hypothetical protein
MQKLIFVLRDLSVQHDVKSYQWDIPENCHIPIPSSIITNFDRNVYLKEHLKECLNHNDCLLTYYWIIQEWGGIGSFKRNDVNDAKIINFLSELDKKYLTKTSFERISSLSKVASFLNPNDYVIYDSRVIYALNWLLFNYAPQVDLFVQPVGRNSDLIKYDMQTIFRLSGKKYVFRGHKNAYHQYCDLMKKLSIEVYGVGSKPYLLEMLLFSIAPNVILKDIEKRVLVKINLESID